MRLGHPGHRPSGRLARLTPSPGSGYSSHLLGGGLAFKSLLSTNRMKKGNSHFWKLPFRSRLVPEEGLARLSLGLPGHRLRRRGSGLTRSRASLIGDIPGSAGG